MIQNFLPVVLVAVISLAGCVGSSISPIPSFPSQKQRSALGILDVINDKDQHADCDGGSVWPSRSLATSGSKEELDQNEESTILSTLFASAVVPPSRRGLVVLGALAISISYVARRVQTSEPLRRATYFWRHAGPIVIHYKWVKRAVRRKSQAERDRAYEILHNKYNQPALAIALHLKGLYVKLGQIMSIRPDSLPRQYIDAFSVLQDSAPAAATEDMQKHVMESLQTNCPRAFYEDFETIQLDPGPPLGSASIGQVHKATLVRKNGTTENVAVKVMHDNVQERFAHDFSVFRWLCKLAIPSWKGFLDALHQQVMTEFDYRVEAQHLASVRANMLASPYRKRVQVPKPFHEITCKNVLVMELLDGQKVVDYIRDQFATAIGSSEVAQKFLEKKRHEVTTGEDAGSKELLPAGLWAKWKLFRLSRRCRKVVHLLVDSHGYQIFENGTWNGDPHFGNCLQLRNGKLGLIDYGQTREMDNDTRLAFARIIVALNDDPNQVASIMRQAGFKLQDESDEMLRQYASVLFDSDIESEKRGYKIAQEYFAHLMRDNPLVSMPDAAIFVARTSLMFRGMGSALGESQIQTAKFWYKHAKKALQEDAKMLKS